MLHLVQIIQLRGLLGHLLKMYFPLHPFRVLHRPGLYPQRRSPAMPQKKPTQSMPCSKFFLLRRFAAPPQIPQRLMSRIRHPYRRQLSGPIISRQFQRMPPIALYAVPSLHRHQAGRHHFAPGPPSLSVASTAPSLLDPPHNKTAAPPPAPVSSAVSESILRDSVSPPTTESPRPAPLPLLLPKSSRHGHPTQQTLLSSSTGSFCLWIYSYGISF